MKADSWELDELANTPSNPASGKRLLYAKDDGIYARNSSGAEVGPFGIAVVPVGCQLGYFKSLTNTPSLPAEFVECNGQTLSDPDSVYDGVVIPDLNGSQVGATQRFLRGSTTSGTTGGSACHSHTVDSHSHTVNSHSHTVNSHSHTVGSHDHDIPTRSICSGSGAPTDVAAITSTGTAAPGTSAETPGTSAASPGTSSASPGTDAKNHHPDYYELVMVICIKHSR